MSAARQLVQGAVELQSLPEVYVQLTEVMQHPHCSATDVACVVNQDPALSTRLLKLANSALFGFQRRIGSVAETITLVGTQQVKDLALATSVVRMFDRLSPDLIDMASFWLHSLACGMCARLIAARRNEDNVERFFLAGLLHDIGSLVLYTRRAREVEQILTRAHERGLLLHQEERAVLGFDHAEVGGELLGAWRLPEPLQQAVARHHAPGADKGHIETAVVHVAEFVVSGLEIGSSGEDSVTPLSRAAWDAVGLKTEDLDGIVAALESQLREVASTFLGRDQV